MNQQDGSSPVCVGVQCASLLSFLGCLRDTLASDVTAPVAATRLEGADLFKGSIEPQLEVVALKQQRGELLAALIRLEFAAQCRDNTSGDPCRLMMVKAELAEAAAQARAAIAKVVRGAPQECRCDLRRRTVGDGCAICNPELAADIKADGES